MGTMGVDVDRRCHHLFLVRGGPPPRWRVILETLELVRMLIDVVVEEEKDACCERTEGAARRSCAPVVVSSSTSTRGAVAEDDNHARCGGRTRGDGAMRMPAFCCRNDPAWTGKNKKLL